VFFSHGFSLIHLFGFVSGPGLLFKAYFRAAQSENQEHWFLIADSDNKDKSPPK
jgi:hypothetical protein